eukprot:g1405.t1
MVRARVFTVRNLAAATGSAVLMFTSSPMIPTMALSTSTNMATVGLAGSIMASLVSSATGVLRCSSKKAYAVLLHGIFGWSTTEVGGLRHFQHAHILEETGCFIVLTPEMAILGSNFDRAAQLHAQLVGGYADHGSAHSSNVSTQHLRYGTTNYTAMIPDFLEPDGLPVYFVAHSLGASTYRQYEILLRDGSDAEKEATPPGNLSSLFEGGHDGRVAGVISLNGALDGTTLVDALGDDVIELAKMAVFTIETLTGDVSADLGFYDYNFGYLGARCPDGYTLDECLEYVMSLPAYNDPNWKDHAGVANLAGAEELNRQGAVTSNQTIYVNFVGNATRPSLLLGPTVYVPQSYMSIILKPFALLIGAYTFDDPQSDEWRPSDGVISVRGQECPLLGLSSSDHCAEFTTIEDMKPGVWQRIYHTLDHIQVIGLTLYPDQLEAGEKIWTDIGDIIQGMEATHGRPFVSEDTASYLYWEAGAAMVTVAVIGGTCLLKKRLGRVPAAS